MIPSDSYWSHDCPLVGKHAAECPEQILFWKASNRYYDSKASGTEPLPGQLHGQAACAYPYPVDREVSPLCWETCILIRSPKSTRTTQVQRKSLPATDSSRKQEHFPESPSIQPRVLA